MNFRTILSGRLFPALATWVGALAILGGRLSAAESLILEFRTGADRLVLNSQDSRQQLLATLGGDRDVTRSVEWSSRPEGIVRIEPSGRVLPLADGKTVVVAQWTNGTTAELPVVVVHSGEPAPIHFANQIVPVFTKNGCNGGGCHGKAAGQNGFRLSLLGFEPAEDYEHLVREAHGRRLFPADPARSLLITKGTAQLPHGGGRRLEPGTEDYDRLVRWVSQGMPLGRSDAPIVTNVEVFPPSRTLALESQQQLVVTAHYSDGSIEDVTRSALFEPNDKDMAVTDSNGLVRVFNQPGEFAVMVRYQSHVATFRATIPLGAPVESLPVARNFVDELVFKQLRKVGMPPSGTADDATFLRRVTLDIAACRHWTRFVPPQSTHARIDAMFGLRIFWRRRTTPNILRTNGPLCFEIAGRKRPRLGVPMLFTIGFGTTSPPTNPTINGCVRF